MFVSMVSIMIFIENSETSLFSRTTWRHSIIVFAVHAVLATVARAAGHGAYVVGREMIVMSPDTPAQDPPKPTIPPRPALVIAGVLLVNVLVLTFAIDERDDFEAGVIWVLLALAASAAASAIPGAMNLNLSPLGNLAVTASGPIVIFFVVFVLKPGILNEDAPSAPTATPAFEFAMESADATPVASPLASPVAPPLASPVASPVVIGSL